jgi:hypothetical protein
LQGKEDAALRAAGQPVTGNDMAGFGQVLIGSLGLLYFLILFVLIMMIFLFSSFWRKR